MATFPVLLSADVAKKCSSSRMEQQSFPLIFLGHSHASSYLHQQQCEAPRNPEKSARTQKCPGSFGSTKFCRRAKYCPSRLQALPLVQVGSSRGQEVSQQTRSERKCGQNHTVGPLLQLRHWSTGSRGEHGGGRRVVRALHRPVCDSDLLVASQTQQTFSVLS